MPLKVSIVINTYNRASSLDATLKSLAYLNYPDFEVIVVNGPSTDSTDEVLRRHAGSIKAGRCPVANLSVSRNIGICMAKGDIVAFIDDDAIPEPEWLSEIVEAYDSPDVAGAGGLVYDHTGYTFQYKYSTCDRLGNARFDHPGAATDYCFPMSTRVPYLQGTNATFRRDVLIEIGGFDEEYEFYLDETDVCTRIVDKGYVLKQLNSARVHHKFAPSHIRNQHRVTTNRYPVVKNKIYFSIKNSKDCDNVSFGDIIDDASRFIKALANDLKSHYEARRVDYSAVTKFWADADRAWRAGLTDALTKERELITPEKLMKYEAPYKRYSPILEAGKKLCVCYLSQDFPPGHNGGIARFTHDLAKGVAALGHQVHVITRGKGHSTVDFEDGVWVHRIVPVEHDLKDAPANLPTFRKNLNYSMTVHEEVVRINESRPIDVIEAPIWDSEGLKCIEDGRFTTVVSLETTVRIASESYPEWLKSPDIVRVMETEDWVLRNAPAFHAISRAIVKTVEEKSGLKIPDEKIGLVPLGVKDESVNYSKKRADGGVTVLFVGRLEKRKGVDVLLGVIPGLCQKFENARFVIAGDNAIPNENGRTYRDEFLEKNAGSPVIGRVHFAGRVSDAELYQLYADCDVFVAPSRYESFGLIFLESMMFSKPVIGCHAGGMVEIIEDGVNGLLAEPGDAASLEEALSALLSDKDKRERFSKRSREIFEASFTVERMCAKMVEFYRSIAAREKSSAV